MTTRKGEVGRIGQKRYGGVFYEEFLPELRGRRGMAAYSEMAANDDLVGAILYAIKMLIRQVDWNVAPGGASEKDQYNGRIVFDGVVESARTALANGIPVGLGNDVGCPYVTQYDFWRELCYFHKYCGVSNAFALHTATLGNAEILGMEDEIGSIAPGKCADLIVTAANPLDDLKALRNVSMVVVRGEIVDISGLKKYPAVEHELDKFLD